MFSVSKIFRNLNFLIIILNIISGKFKFKIKPSILFSSVLLFNGAIVKIFDESTSSNPFFLDSFKKHLFSRYKKRGNYSSSYESRSVQIYVTHLLKKKKYLISDFLANKKSLIKFSKNKKNFDFSFPVFYRITKKNGNYRNNLCFKKQKCLKNYNIYEKKKMISSLKINKMISNNRISFEKSLERKFILTRKACDYNDICSNILKTIIAKIRIKTPENSSELTTKYVQKLYGTENNYHIIEKIPKIFFSKRRWVRINRNILFTILNFLPITWPCPKPPFSLKSWIQKIIALYRNFDLVLEKKDNLGSVSHNFFLEKIRSRFALSSKWLYKLIENSLIFDEKYYEKKEPFVFPFKKIKICYLKVIILFLSKKIIAPEQIDRLYRRKTFLYLS